MNTASKYQFYGILDTAYVSDTQWVAKYRALADGGAAIIQLRAKNSTHRHYQTLIESILEYRASPQQRSEKQPSLILNDDLQLCLSYQDLGLHLEHNETHPAKVREELGPDRILGISATTENEVNRAIAFGRPLISYFSVGAVFPSQTKPEAPQAGLELVRYAASRNTEIPFFCIGGINRANIHQVREAGATRIVTVADTLCDTNTRAAVRQSLQRLADSLPSPVTSESTSE